jgi:hypothetical protein
VRQRIRDFSAERNRDLDPIRWTDIAQKLLAVNEACNYWPKSERILATTDQNRSELLNRFT